MREGMRTPMPGDNPPGPRRSAERIAPSTVKLKALKNGLHRLRRSLPLALIFLLASTTDAVASTHELFSSFSLLKAALVALAVFDLAGAWQAFGRSVLTYLRQRK